MDPDDRPRARPATPQDYPHFVRFFQELATDDPVPIPERYEQQIMPCALFLERGGKLAAYGYIRVMGDIGHVGHVVVDPDCRGERVGRALMAAIAARLRDAGCSRWCLNVKVGNVPALRLYERFGLAPVFAATALRFPWSALAALERDPARVVARSLEPAHEAELEAAFHLHPGQLAESRKRPGRVLFQATDAATERERLGIASFDPAFPGAYPFRAAEPHAAAALLDAVRPHALPEHDFVFVTIDEDADLTRHLVEAGAAVRFEMLHLRGTIPPPP